MKPEKVGLYARVSTVDRQDIDLHDPLPRKSKTARTLGNVRHLPPKIKILLQRHCSVAQMKSRKNLNLLNLQIIYI